MYDSCVEPILVYAVSFNCLNTSRSHRVATFYVNLIIKLLPVRVSGVISLPVQQLPNGAPCLPPNPCILTANYSSSHLFCPFATPACLLSRYLNGLRGGRD